MAHGGRSQTAPDPVNRLKSEAAGLIGALGDRAIASLRDRVEETAGRLSDYSHDGSNGGGPGLIAALTGAKGLAEGKSPLRSIAGAGMAGLKEKAAGLVGNDGGRKGSRGKGMKVTNIVEQIDVGAPIDLTYNLWTQLADFPSFMKKVESVEQAEDERLNWRAQILWSHRSWESTILEQTPDEKIIWRSQGAKGYVDGAVTFHELAPRLTRILLVLEYHPQGFFEHTGNLWRAQGRRVRLELKHFRRHLMSEVLLHPDEVQGWRGVIQDGEAVDQEDGKSVGDDDEPDRGERADRARRAERPGRTDREHRGDHPQPGPERARRAGDPRRPVAPPRPKSGERAGGERPKRVAAGRPAR